MSSVRLVFSSDAAGSRRTGPVRSLSSLAEGTRATIAAVSSQADGRADRLLALGVTPGAAVVMLQTFPGVVFLCDQTELAVERGVADDILVRVQEIRS
jgi:Fe2+ transport system protein FeoA